MLQGHVASDHGWLVVLSGPGRSGGDEPGFEAIGGCVHKRRALNTRLSSGTSAGTFAVSAGPYRNYQAEAGTKNEPDPFFVPIQRKGWKLDPHVSNIRSREYLFQGVQVHPFNSAFHSVGPTLRSYPRTTFCLTTTCEQAHYIFPHELVASSMVGKSARKSQRRRGQSRDIKTGQATHLWDPDAAVGELGGDASLPSSACIAFPRLAPFHKTSTDFDGGN